MKNKIKEWILENKKTILILSICMLAGVFSGLIAFQFMDGGVKTELINSIQGVMNQAKSENFKGVNILDTGIKNNVVIFGIFLLTSLTIIAPVVVCVICLFKGFSVRNIYCGTDFHLSRLERLSS